MIDKSRRLRELRKQREAMLKELGEKGQRLDEISRELAEFDQKVKGEEPEREDPDLEQLKDERWVNEPKPEKKS